MREKRGINYSQARSIAQLVMTCCVDFGLLPSFLCDFSRSPSTYTTSVSGPRLD